MIGATPATGRSAGRLAGPRPAPSTMIRRGEGGLACMSDMVDERRRVAHWPSVQHHPLGVAPRGAGDADPWRIRPENPRQGVNFTVITSPSATT